MDDGLSETQAVCHDSHTDMRHKICKLIFIILVMLQQILSSGWTEIVTLAQKNCEKNQETLFMLDGCV